MSKEKKPVETTPEESAQTPEAEAIEANLPEAQANPPETQTNPWNRSWNSSNRTWQRNTTSSCAWPLSLTTTVPAATARRIASIPTPKLRSRKNSCLCTTIWPALWQLKLLMRPIKKASR